MTTPTVKDVPEHLQQQLSADEVEAFRAPRFGLHSGCEDPSWVRCPSVYAECPELHRRCIGAVGHHPHWLHINRSGFAWNDTEAYESAIAELENVTAERDRLGEQRDRALALCDEAERHGWPRKSLPGVHVSSLRAVYADPAPPGSADT